MAARQEVVNHHNLLLQEWNKRPANLQKVGQLLDKMKILLTQVAFLPTSQADKSDVARVKQDLIMARDVLEIGSLWSVASKTVESFARYTAQLKTYYFDYKDDLPESAYKYQLLGLNLLSLLSQNRVAEFHTELELLSAEEIKNNVYIHHPVNLEQWLMEGAYNKVFLSRANVPAESYNYFMDILLNTIRTEIASCIEAAYERISLSEAARILFFSSANELRDFVASQGKTWAIDGQILVFSTEKRAQEKAINKIPAEHIAVQAIEYAKELEMIV
ncbi:26S proteasome non-ATPase regulatory subunit 8 [Halotydeus destructor]|nr:26S proteasome non-ATPase regulatory subunit 8 [Halotydeus destructor]